MRTSYSLHFQWVVHFWIEYCVHCFFRCVVHIRNEWFVHFCFHWVVHLWFDSSVLTIPAIWLRSQALSILLICALRVIMHFRLGRVMHSEMLCCALSTWPGSKKLLRSKHLRKMDIWLSFQCTVCASIDTRFAIWKVLSSAILWMHHTFEKDRRGVYCCRASTQFAIHHPWQNGTSVECQGILLNRSIEIKMVCFRADL